MAFAKRLASLTEELVEAATPSSSVKVNTDALLLDALTDPRALKTRCDAIQRHLKANSYLRTNQFEVSKSLDGLEERFRVCQREELADALRQKLIDLEEHSSKWHPEILSLFLELSDQPTFKTRLADVASLQPPPQDPGATLRWEDIAREDGWAEDAAIWKSNSFSDESDNGFDHDDLDGTASESDLTSISGQDNGVGRSPEDFIVHPQDAALLQAVKNAQAWRRDDHSRNTPKQARKTAISEMDVVREVLFMLQGLETSLFDADCTPVAQFQISHLTWDTHKAVVNAFSQLGRQLSILRAFVEEPLVSPHLQVFQECIIKRLQVLDTKTSKIQSRLACPTTQVVVSLAALRRELTPWLEPLYALGGILEQVSNAPGSGHFYYLEVLFDEAIVAQVTGRITVYDFLARIFIECFNVFLRPIRLWMEEGRLITDDEIFFVAESRHEVPLGSIWHERFKLRHNHDGTLHAPKFLHPAVTQIFNAGKNIVILKRLGKYSTESGRFALEEPWLDYDTICREGGELAPFAELFEAAFDRWIQSKYRKTSVILRDELFDACALSASLDALQHLYLMSDGSVSGTFCDDLFAKIDAGDDRWHNRYALTAVGHDVFAAHVDTARLAIDVERSGADAPNIALQSTVRTALPSVRIQYRLAWPVQMIITPETLTDYHALFTLQLQVKRALHALHKFKVLDNYKTDDERWDDRALFYSSRTNLLWFCTTFQTYLSTLVLAPNLSKMRHDLRTAPDVDSMIGTHTAALNQMVGEACLGSRLGPIREAVLDVFDLALRLERARAAHAKSPDHAASYTGVLREIRAGFDKNLRFVVGGLRSVARAADDAQSTKWDMLAEMLQTGGAGDV